MSSSAFWSYVANPILPSLRCQYSSVSAPPFSTAPVMLCRLLDSLIEFWHMLILRPRTNLRFAALDLAALLEINCSRLEIGTATGGREYYASELCEPRVSVVSVYFL